MNEPWMRMGRESRSTLTIGANIDVLSVGPSCPLPAPAHGTVLAPRRRHRLWPWLVRLAPLAILIVLVAWELATSQLQSIVFAHLARSLYYDLGDGPSPIVRFPETGPFDTRLGYTQIPGLSRRLEAEGFAITRQARISRLFTELVDRGAYPIYHEKMQAGLTILDASGKVIHESLYPRRIYESFDEIPEILVSTLLFVENRSLLDERYPHRNPSIEWKRFANAVVGLATHKVGRAGRPSGGSTLATQMEKFRHSFEGRTVSLEDKFRQMISASFRVYLGGEKTIESQKRIVLNYINSVPLAAVAGHGEVFGIGDGLWAWYGADFDDVDRLLWLACAHGTDTCAPNISEQAQAYRRVLSLILAHRRPTYYLNGGRHDLEELTDRYLRLLARGGIISEGFRDLALKTDAALNERSPEPSAPGFPERKLSSVLRAHLLSRTGMRSLYDLDHLDLTVRTTIDRDVQAAITDVLRRLSDAEFVRAAGLDGDRLLGRGDITKIIYAFTLYERTGGANVLRVQADTFDGPFNINEGIKLDLGSTAKLRTFVSYLEIIADLHAIHWQASAAQLEAAEAQIGPLDELSRWAVEYLKEAQDRSLEKMLIAAADRRYSASPNERFFTGGGLHRFSNFDHLHDRRSVTVREALRHSVNLPFIRMMRDMVHYLMSNTHGLDPSVLDERDDPRRVPYLERFADREGREFLTRFFRKHGADEGTGDSRGIDESALILCDHCAKVHPLERWLVDYLRGHPAARWNEIVTASAGAREEAYRWLFRTSRKKVQDRAIRIMLEVDAFKELHQRWTRLGYPFDRLVPSFATAIGSSADRPAALARLVGIILNDGVDVPMARVDSLYFGEGTPFETRFERRINPGVQVLPREIASLIREALRDVVENGTARRLAGIRPDASGHRWIVGGKTGTADHRHKVIDSRGHVIESRPVNRAATFVFFIDDRFFGTLTAYVPGKGSGNHRFTSALPVAVLGILAPKLEPILEGRALDPKYAQFIQGHPVMECPGSVEC